MSSFVCSDRPELLRRRYDENLALLGRVLPLILERVDEAAEGQRRVVLMESEVRVLAEERRRP